MSKGLLELQRAVSNAEPKWVRRLSLAVALPSFLCIVVLILSGSLFDYPELIFACMAAIGASAMLSLFFVARAFWRMEI